MRRKGGHFSGLLFASQEHQKHHHAKTNIAKDADRMRSQKKHWQVRLSLKGPNYRFVFQKTPEELTWQWKILSFNRRNGCFSIVMLVFRGLVMVLVWFSIWPDEFSVDGKIRPTGKSCASWVWQGVLSVLFTGFDTGQVVSRICEEWTVTCFRGLGKKRCSHCS